MNGAEKQNTFTTLKVHFNVISDFPSMYKM